MHFRAVGQGMTKFGPQFWTREEQSDHKVRRRDLPPFSLLSVCMNKNILATDPIKTEEYSLLTFLRFLHRLLWL